MLGYVKPHSLLLWKKILDLALIWAIRSLLGGLARNVNQTLRTIAAPMKQRAEVLAGIRNRTLHGEPNNARE